MTLSYGYIGVALAAMAILAGWMFVSSRYHVVWRAVASVVIVVLSLTIWINITALLGYSVTGLPPNGSTLISAVINKSQRRIDIWVLRPFGPRAYVIPYSAGTAEVIERAMQRSSSSGGRMILHLSPHATRSRHGQTSHRGINDPHPPQVEVHIDVVPLLPDKS